jgi:hypothetical protein
MSNEINAFHPDFVKTHMPEFMASVRTDSKQTTIGQNVSKYVEKKRKTTPSHGTVFGISKVVLPAHMNRPKEVIRRPIQTKAQQSMTMQEVTAELIEKLKHRNKK